MTLLAPDLWACQSSDHITQCLGVMLHHRAEPVRAASHRVGITGAGCRRLRFSASGLLAGRLFSCLLAHGDIERLTDIAA